VLHAKGLAKVGYTLLARSIIDSEFTGRIEEEVSIAETTGIRPSISGRAWITGKYQLMLDPGDPYPEGYRLSDTWPKLS
jgi:proline racemase